MIHTTSYDGNRDLTHFFEIKIKEKILEKLAKKIQLETKTGSKYSSATRVWAFATHKFVPHAAKKLGTTPSQNNKPNPNIKVFCFFFSKKKRGVGQSPTVLPLTLPLTLRIY